MHKKILPALMPALISVALGTNTPAAAQDATQMSEEVSSEEPATKEASTDSPKVLKRIVVLDSKQSETSVAGSATLLDGERLQEKLAGIGDVHKVLREVPGVNIQEEDGYGLRPNIGFRGVPNERSAKITLMEDSILIAPAPYSAPSAYYFPSIGRMEAVEVVKGASQLKYGPYTTGGALNLRSTSIPDERSGRASLAAGTDNTKKLRATVGESWTYGGIMLETHQLETDGFKELDGGGDTGFDIEDYNLKARINSDPDADLYQELEYKLGAYDQLANETYLGLTEDDFSKNPYRRYAGSQRDRIDVDHGHHQVRHYVEISENLDLTTQAYYNETRRNWTKLEQVNGESVSSILATPNEFADEIAWIRGQTSDEGAFTIRGNSRDYEAKGIQSTVGARFETGPLKHSLEASARFHSDEEDRFQANNKFSMIDGTLVLSEKGEPGSQANRISSADAWAFYLGDAISYEKLTVTPMLRYERINYTREDFGSKDPSRSGADLRRSDTDINSLIPGLGISYAITDELQGFAGIHKGFSPPGPQGSGEVEEEESINYELGGRYRQESFAAELVLFFSDYDNLLGADTLSSGGTGSGDLFNAGEVHVWGLESGVSYDLAKLIDVPFKLPARATYTFTRAEFRSTFESDLFGNVTKGDQLTYVPKHQFRGSIGAEYEAYALNFGGTFVDSMITEAGLDESIANDTDSFMVFDILASYKLNQQVKLFGTIENLFDREYVVARRPAGARPGIPLTGLVGLEVTF